MSEIDISPRDDPSRRLWAGVGDLAELLPPGWVLIGGLMVQLHALERGISDVRATIDVDVLGQARPKARSPRSTAFCDATALSPSRPTSTATPTATNARA